MGPTNFYLVHDYKNCGPNGKCDPGLETECDLIKKKDIQEVRLVSRQGLEIEFRTKGFTLKRLFRKLGKACSRPVGKYHEQQVRKTLYYYQLSVHIFQDELVKMELGHRG